MNMLHYYPSIRRTTMNLKPLNDWVVVRPSEAEEVTAGGLFIPETAKTKPQEGVVEAIGPGAYEEEKERKKKEEKKERKFVPTTIKPGDRVLYERYAGRTYTLDGEEIILVRERDILGILPGDRSPRPRPLLIPAATSAVGTTALVKQASAAPAGRTAPAKKKAVKKAKKKASAKPSAVKKTKKKAVAKSTTVKKAVKKAAAKKGSPVKKAAAKKGPKATVRKTAARKTKKKK
jgi:chaperonin GroES